MTSAVAGESVEAEQRKQGLGEALAKIRHHTSSKLPNQKAPAQLLVAVEETLGAKDDGKAKGEQRSPTEYLMALQAMLKKATKDAERQKANPNNNSTLLPSTVYLLTLVTPFVAPGVLRSQLQNLIEPLGTVLSTPYPSSTQQAESHAALLRSAMGVLQQLLLALATDRATLSSHLQLRGCWNSTLRLCMDARPKVRRKAQELVGKVLETEENAKAHPYAAKTAEWAISALEEVNVSGSINSTQVKAPTFDKKTGRAAQPEVAAAERQKRVDGGNANTGIWVCAFLKQLAPVLPSKSIPHLSTNLLRLISQRNPFLSTAAFEVFESLFRMSRPQEESSFTTTSHATIHSSFRTSAKKINTDMMAQTLDALCSASVKPSANDVQLVPAYLRALENAMVAYSRVDDGLVAWKRVPAIWKSITDLSLSTGSKASRDSPQTRLAGRDALSALTRYCIPDQAIEEAIAAKSQGKDHPLLTIIDFFEDSLTTHALRYTHSQSAILSVLANFMLRLRHGSASSSSSSIGRADPAANVLLLPIIATIASLRSQPNFEHREEADGVIGAAIQVCGPAAVLEILPLNLVSEEGPVQGRAWLLPLMKSRTTNSQLAHFVSVMVPLSESLFNKRAEAEEQDENGKVRAPVQAKVYEALIEQVWALFAGYCDLPTDMPEALNSTFVELLANVLYSQSTLRPSICRGLQLLVERNLSLASSSAEADILKRNFGLSNIEGKANIAQLSSMGPGLLAVLFNVFSQSPGESRGYLSDCINAYLGIMSQEEVCKTYDKIVSMLEEALPNLVPARDREVGRGSVPPVPHTMLDLLILMVPYLDSLKEGSKLFQLACDDKLLACRDAGLQKKTYRLLSRLMDGKRGKQILQVGEGNAGRLQELLEKLRSTTENVVMGAKRDRTALLASVVPLIPQSELHFLPSIIPEAVLATKEINQGARELAYNLLVEMGNKMESGGQIKRHLVEGASGKNEAADEDQDEEMKEDIVQASLNEYITMVAAGLAGASPHMVSATIMAMARLVYEFHPRLPLQTLKELVSTLEVFLASPNREIVKSTLGFVKVVVVSLPTTAMDDNLADIVRGLLSDENHHRQHFKAKIRHIFERLLRRFGYEKIESMTDEENRKLLVNIRKRKERAKKKKASQVDAINEEGEEDMVGIGAGQRAAKSVGADAFEEAIYGSESDLSDSDDDGDADHEMTGYRGRSQVRGAGQPVGGQRKEKRRGRDAEGQEYILKDDDAPMDLLDRSIAAGGRIIAGNASNKSGKRQPGQEARKFELDEATGRMVIDDDAEVKTGDGPVDVDGAGRAYIDRERGTHGITSNNGVVRINKNNKRNRAADDELELEQMIVEEAQQQQQIVSTTGGNAEARKIKKGKAAIGAEFKAKKAGGDIKRGQTKPYAYVPLNQIGSKNKSNNVKILNKEKKRKV
jgi:ribosomal RNA-processing protein 12